MNDIGFSQLPWEDIIKRLAIAHANPPENSTEEQYFKSLVHLFLSSPALRYQYLRQLSEIGRRDHREKYYQATGLTQERIKLIERFLSMTDLDHSSLWLTDWGLLEIVADSISWAQSSENLSLMPYPEAYSITKLLLEELNSEHLSEGPELKQWTIDERLFLACFWFNPEIPVRIKSKDKRSINFLSVIMGLKGTAIKSAFNAFLLMFSDDLPQGSELTDDERAQMTKIKKSMCKVTWLFMALSLNTEFKTSGSAKNIAEAADWLNKCFKKILREHYDEGEQYNYEDLINGPWDIKERLYIMYVARVKKVIKTSENSFISDGDRSIHVLLSIILNVPIASVENSIEVINHNLFQFKRHAQDMNNFALQKPEPSLKQAVLKMREVETQVYSLRKMISLLEDLTASNLYGNKTIKTVFESIKDTLLNIDADRCKYFDLTSFNELTA